MSRKTARNLNHQPDLNRKAVAEDNRIIRMDYANRLRQSGKKADGSLPPIPFYNRKTHRAWLKSK